MPGPQRHADDLLVGAFLVRHVEDPDDATPDAAAGEGRLAHEDERIQRVAVAAERALDEPVVGRVRHRREEPPVEDDGAELVVELVLVPRARRDLHEDDDGLGHALRLVDLGGTAERCRR